MKRNIFKSRILMFLNFHFDLCIRWKAYCTQTANPTVSLYDTMVHRILPLYLMYDFWVEYKKYDKLYRWNIFFAVFNKNLVSTSIKLATYREASNWGMQLQLLLINLCVYNIKIYIFKLNFGKLCLSTLW